MSELGHERIVDQIEGARSPSAEPSVAFDFATQFARDSGSALLQGE
jgi:hypothetical protein